MHCVKLNESLLNTTWAQFIWRNALSVKKSTEEENLQQEKEEQNNNKWYSYKCKQPLTTSSFVECVMLFEWIVSIQWNDQKQFDSIPRYDDDLLPVIDNCVTRAHIE